MGKVTKEIPSKKRADAIPPDMNTSAGQNRIHIIYTNVAGGLLCSYFMLRAYFTNTL